jgi:hypothetical protein
LVVAVSTVPDIMAGLILWRAAFSKLTPRKKDASVWGSPRGEALRRD